jgi:hypothetical protein
MELAPDFESDTGITKDVQLDQLEDPVSPIAAPGAKKSKKHNAASKRGAISVKRNGGSIVKPKANGRLNKL